MRRLPAIALLLLLLALPAGATDLQALIDSTPAGGEVTIPSGLYRVRTPLDLRHWGIGMPPAPYSSGVNGLVVTRPITVHAAGVVLDGGLFIVADGARVEGITTTLFPEAGEVLPWGGIIVYGSGVTLDNVTSFGNYQGVVSEQHARGGSILNSRVWGNGITAPNRSGYGHELYLQNDGTAEKLVQDCFIGSGRSSFSFHAYAKTVPLKWITMRRCRVSGPECVIESGQGCDRVLLDQCSFYGAVLLGVGAAHNGTITIHDCAFHQSRQQVTVTNWDQVTMTGTLVAGWGIIFDYRRYTGPGHTISASSNVLMDGIGGVGFYNWGAVPPPAVFGKVPVHGPAAGWWRD